MLKYNIFITTGMKHSLCSKQPHKTDEFAKKSMARCIVSCTSAAFPLFVDSLSITQWGWKTTFF